MAAQQPNRHVRLDKSLHFTSHEILFGVLKQAAAEMPVQPSFQPSRVPDTSERKEGSLTRKTLIKHLKLLISARAQHWFWSRIGRHVTGPLLRPTEVAKYWRLRVLDAMTYSWMVVAVALIAIGVLATSLSGIHNIGAAAAVSLLLAVCPLCILGYYGLNADGSFPHSLEVLTVVMILAAVASERMGLPTITLVMTGCLTGFVFCPLHIKWKRGVLIGSVKRGLLALCSLAFATGAAVSTRAGQLNVTALREYVLVGVLIAFIIVGLHCKTPRMRYFGLTVVLACGTGALLATAAASLSQIRGSEAMLFGMSLFLSVGASMLARIIWAFAAGRGFKRSLNQVVESVPFWSAVTQTVAVIAAWIALACVVRVEHRPFAIVALVIVAALLLLLCLLDVPRYLISSCVAWLLRADDAIAARKWLSSGDKVEYLARRIRTTDSLRFTLAPIVDWIVCASAIDVDRGLQLLDEYSQSSCEIRSIARVLEMLLKTSQNTCRVFTWAIACGWTKELVTVGNKNEIARDMARLLFALGVLPTAPYSKNRALTIRSKGVVHEIARLDVNDQTHLAWEVDRSLKGRLDSDTYASFERLTKLIITVEGSDPKRLVTIGEELAAIGGDRLFAHCVVSEARMRLSSVASRLSEIGREAYVKGQGVTAADHDWLTEQKEWLGQNDNSEKRSVFGIAASFVLGRLLAAVSD